MFDTPPEGEWEGLTRALQQPRQWIALARNEDRGCPGLLGV